MAEAIVLTNDLGMQAHVLPLGAVIQRLLVPSKDGSGPPVDVVLGFDDPAAYQDNPNYLGAVAGRCANRIALGKFELGGRHFQLACNNGPNALHGGPEGFHVRAWQAERADTAEGAGVVLTYVSKDGEEGYPGTLTVRVTYCLSKASNELSTTISATTDQDTLVNIAQHSYFNLGGAAAGSSILDHVLTIHGGTHYTPVDDDLIPTGEIAPVAGGPFDFTSPHAVGERLAEAAASGAGYDHNYVLHGLGPDAQGAVAQGVAFPEPRPAVTLTHPGSGRTLEVSTNAPAMQLYTGGFLNAVAGKAGGVYQRYGGLCLETQGFPDAINHPNFPSVVLGTGQEYIHKIVYRFSYV